MRTARLSATGLLLIIVAISWTGKRPPDCKAIQNGTFYFYPEDQKKGYKLIREDTLQMEIELKTRDTSFWKIQWIDDCTCSSKFISMTKKKVDKNFLEYLNNHIAFMEVLEVEDKFYKMRIYSDSLTNDEYLEAMVWRQPK